MIFINPDGFVLPVAVEQAHKVLAEYLVGWPEELRSDFIDGMRDDAWSHPAVLKALKDLVGDKCWYSEVPLTGADPNVDHFRPKGRVREIDDDLKNTGMTCQGYWWLAFEPLNYRLASMHTNQRRVDENTAGGKSDYFPIRGARAPALTPWENIREDILPLDPCSMSDVRLLWFDPDGKPCPAKWKDCDADDRDVQRVEATIWLYHLDKTELQSRRSGHVQGIRKDLRKANADYQLWNPSSVAPNFEAKTSFDQKIAEIKIKIGDQADFAGAKRCAVRAAIVDYPWIEQFNIV